MVKFASVLSGQRKKESLGTPNKSLNIFYQPISIKRMILNVHACIYLHITAFICLYLFFVFTVFCFEPVLWNSLSLTKHNKMRTILLANVKNK